MSENKTFSMTITIIVMALIAVVVGYFLGIWMVKMATGETHNQQQQVATTNKQEVQPEKSDEKAVADLDIREDNSQINTDRDNPVENKSKAEDTSTAVDEGNNINEGSNTDEETAAPSDSEEDISPPESQTSPPAEEDVKSGEAATASEQSSQEIFMVQVGAFGNYNNAVKLKKKVAEEGFEDVFITTKAPYRVRVGSTRKREEAEEIKKRLEQLGYNAFVTN